MEKQINSTDATNYAAIFFVRDLSKQVIFYTETIGLELQWRSDRQAGLGGCKTNVLLLTNETQQKENAPLDIKLPSRRELAKVVGRLYTLKYPGKTIDYGDRQVAEVIDPEGNQINISVNIEGAAAKNGEALDIEALFNQLDPDDRLCDKMSEATRFNQQ